MSDENPTPNQPDQSANSSPEVQSSESVNPPKTTQPNPANELQDVKKELNGYERSTLRWTRIIVGVNVLTCLFIGLQWYEIKSGSGDTHALAEAAKTQSQKMSNMSDAADKIRQAAENMVVQDQRIADNAQNALEANNRESKAALDATINQFRDEHRPWLGLKDAVQVEERPDNNYVYWTVNTSVWNYGSFPATRVITIMDTGKSVAYRIRGTWKNTENCKNAAQLSRSSPDYYPNAGGLFPATSLPFSDARSVEAGSIYLAICIAYTDATKRPYSTKLLYIKAREGFRLLDADIE